MQFWMSTDIAHAGRNTRRESAATHLNKNAIHTMANFFQQLPAKGAATVEAPRVFRALHTEWNRASGNNFTESENARIARRIRIKTGTNADICIQ
jgi:hypothetical protein